MTDITKITEEGFFQWLILQLEKHEIVCGWHQEKEKRKEELYEILFYEQNLTVEEIEQFFIPFGQAGYLSPRKKFELMLFVLEKDYGTSNLFLEGAGEDKTITGQDVEDVYLQWLQEGRLYLSEEEKKEFFVQSLLDTLEAGVLEVLERLSPDGILLGEFCPVSQKTEKIEQRIGICFGSNIVRLPFLEVETEEELSRIVKYTVAKEKKGELTRIEPMLDFVREDGTCITAVRPPATAHWGVRILYGAARKEEAGWRKQLDL